MSASNTKKFLKWKFHSINYVREVCYYKPKLNNSIPLWLYTATIFILRNIMFGDTCEWADIISMIFSRVTDFRAKCFFRSIKYTIKDKYFFYSRYRLKTFSLWFPDVSECLLNKSNKHQNNLGEFSEKPDLPYFDKAASKNVTSPLGKTAYLNCRVKNLANRTVSKQNN